ncbi:NADPH-dependent F420 reductase [Streptomyces lasalocidi]
MIDTGNYSPQRDGSVEALDDGSTTSSELLQRYLGESAHVVKAFNNIHHTHLAVLNRPAGAEDRTALPIAGDSDEAKRHTTELLDALGYDAVDAGSLAQGRLFAPGTAGIRRPVHGAAQRVVRLPGSRRCPSCVPLSESRPGFGSRGTSAPGEGVVESGGGARVGRLRHPQFR